MTELMKQYMKETGESIQIRGTLMGRNYAVWLENKVISLEEQLSRKWLPIPPALEENKNEL